MKKARTVAAQAAAAAPALRGRKPIFRKEDVVAAALALVDRDGHEALSMRAIAADLGAGVATLYHYFASLAELKDALALALLEQIPLLDATNARDARQQLKDLAMAYARIAVQHPDFEQMVGPLAERQVMRLLDSALRVMFSVGVEKERAGASWTVLGALAQTHAASSRRHNSVRRPETRKEIEGLDAVLALADAGVFKASHEEWFGRVLDLTIDRMLPELAVKPSRR